MALAHWENALGAHSCSATLCQGSLHHRAQLRVALLCTLQPADHDEAERRHLPHPGERIYTFSLRKSATLFKNQKNRLRSPLLHHTHLPSPPMLSCASIHALPCMPGTVGGLHGLLLACAHLDCPLPGPCRHACRQAEPGRIYLFINHAASRPGLHAAGWARPSGLVITCMHTWPYTGPACSTHGALQL